MQIPKPHKLSVQQRTEALDALNTSLEVPWQIQDDVLYKRFVFRNFRVAFASLSLMAIIAETIDHHPHITHCWNVIEYRLSTHSCQGISQLDFVFARKLEDEFTQLRLQ